MAFYGLDFRCFCGVFAVLFVSGLCCVVCGFGVCVLRLADTCAESVVGLGNGRLDNGMCRVRTTVPMGSVETCKYSRKR